MRGGRQEERGWRGRKSEGGRTGENRINYLTKRRLSAHRAYFGSFHLIGKVDEV